MVLSAVVLFRQLSCLLTACERLLKNRWMASLRAERPRRVADVLIAFSARDVLLSVRLAAFYWLHLLGRGILLLSLPTALTAAALIVFVSGVSRKVFIGGAVCLLLLWLAALFFFCAARESLRAAAALITDESRFEQRKSSLARLDKGCLQLAKCSVSWLPLPGCARFQAKAIYADQTGAL